MALQNEGAAWEGKVSRAALCVLKPQGRPGTKVFLTHLPCYQKIFLNGLIKV